MIGILSNFADVNAAGICKNLNIDKNLLLEINHFINKLECEKKENDSNIIFIEFIKKENECYVNIGVANIYNSKTMKGYFILKDRMIVFYEIENNCHEHFVRYKKLKHKRNKNFNDQNSVHSDDFFDPYGKKFIVTNDYSLELIYEGFF